MNRCPNRSKAGHYYRYTVKKAWRNKALLWCWSLRPVFPRTTKHRPRAKCHKRIST
jgi:hypothetical protein